MNTETAQQVRKALKNVRAHAVSADTPLNQSYYDGVKVGLDIARQLSAADELDKNHVTQVIQIARHQLDKSHVAGITQGLTIALNSVKHK